MSKELLTSHQWQQTHPDPVVMDPDGWDRKNYQFSWFEEFITEQEYFNRVMHSSCVGNIKDFVAKMEAEVTPDPTSEVPKKFYRVCNKETLQGLWYDYKGQFTGLIHEEFGFCTNTKLEMDFDEEIVGWLSATDSLETLWKWFTKEDILQLQKHGWFIHEFEAVDVKFYERFQHQVINQETSKVLRVIELEDVDYSKAALENYKKFYEGEPLTWEVPVDAFVKGVLWRENNMSDDLDLRCNFISVDHKIARNSYGEFFKVGHVVGNEDSETDDVAEILSFELDEESNEVKANTTRGWAHIDFIFKS